MSIDRVTFALAAPANIESRRSGTASREGERLNSQLWDLASELLATQGEGAQALALSPLFCHGGGFSVVANFATIRCGIRFGVWK
jgi:hypothetical protein